MKYYGSDYDANETHPEQQSGERFFTNTDKINLEKTLAEIKTKKGVKGVRVGSRAYWKNGTRDRDMVPVFINNEHWIRSHNSKKAADYMLRNEGN